MSKGLYIAIEGPPGAGKTTQIELLTERLRAQGYIVRNFKEPDTQTNLTARSIREIMQDPHYPMNSKTEVLLYNAARTQSLEVIRKARDNGLICLAERSYLSTLAMQYYGRGDIPDYQTINTIIDFAVGDMVPNMTIVLDAPSSVLVSRSNKPLSDTEIAYFDRVRAGYLLESRAHRYPVIEAVDSPDTVHQKIWKLLHGGQVEKSVSVAINSNPKKNVVSEPVEPAKLPLLKTAKNGFEITKEGKEFLDRAVTNVDGNIYAFRKSFSSVTAAAAMARLSRRFDDLRVTLLDEFTDSPDENENLLKRVITAYGDDSVQQLVGQHIVVEGASNLLTKKLEWGRLAAYLEQSTRYIYYDQKDKHGHYKYYIPPDLDKKTKKIYRETLNRIFTKYSTMVHAATKYVRDNSSVPANERDGAWEGATRAQACDAIRYVLPVATKSTVGIYASGQAVESLIMHLLADDLAEARIAGKKILTESRKVIPAFLERADKPERGGATIAYQANRRHSVQKLANKHLPNKYSEITNPVTLVDVWPHNELDIVPDILYEHSNMSLDEIHKEVNKWSYKQKLNVFNAYIGERLNRRQKPGRAFEKIHYNWDLVCDYGIFRDLQRHRMVDDLEWQALTPRYGYEIPELVEKAGLTELYLDCFDLSIELYSLMQKAGYETESQYVTLMGHKMRWKVTYNGREAFHIHELRTVPQGHPGYRKLVSQMHEQVLNIHPLIGEAMKFVNQGEDPELNRLAAERYTQYKLKILEN